MNFTVMQQQADGSFAETGVQSWADIPSAQAAINALAATAGAVVIAQYASGTAQTSTLKSA